MRTQDIDDLGSWTDADISAYLHKEGLKVYDNPELNRIRVFYLLRRRVDEDK